jgi:hypothetical protein
MRSSGKHLRLDIHEVTAGPIVDFGPVIDPPFVDGISREVYDRAISLNSVEDDMPQAAVAAQARNTAQRDPRVVAALGHRWEFIGVGIVYHKKRRRSELRVVWYVYDTDQTVEAITDDKGAYVRDVRVNFRQPAFTDREQARANELVAASGRLPRTRDGRGLPVEDTDRLSPRYGHRLVHLRFNPDGTCIPRWWALVDLSRDELVDAGDVPGD